MDLLLPTDGCDNCMTVERSFPVHPYRVDEDFRADSIRAWYKCPACGYRWWTGWTSEALDVPCPGCPSCAIPKAGAA